MIQAIIRFSIRQRAFVVLLGFVLIAAGLYSAFRLPVDAVPDITNKQVVVTVNVPGLGPEEVEKRITFPIELSMSGMPKLVEVRSISQFGLSQVQVVFEDNTDIYFARQLVNERIGEAKESLPEGVEVEVGPVSTGLGEIYNVTIDNDDLSLREKRTLMDWVVAPQLRTVPGIAEVNTWGGEVKQLQVLMDPERLYAYGLTVQDVTAAIAQNNSNAGGAYMEKGSEQEIIRSVGVIEDLEDIEQIVVATKNGVPITMADIGEVTEGAMVRQGGVTANGEGEQVLAITMLMMGDNGRIVVERVKDRLVQIEKSLPEGSKLVGFLDRSELIMRTLKTAVKNLVEGGLLVILVLFLFLLQLRAGLIVSSAIPLAMLFAIIGMKQFGVSANLMSLGAIDFGLIVDGAVIIVENCVRRLSERRQALGRDLTDAERDETILSGAVEVRRATQFGEMIIIASYIPILTLSGIEGKTFRPMGLTVILALTGAMLLSFTMIPALCSYFLKVRKERENPVLEWIKPRYQRTLERVMKGRILWTGAAALFVAGCLAIYPRLGSVFVPKLDEGSLAVQIVHPPSISLEETVRKSGEIERLLLERFPDEIDQIVSRIGRSELATDPMPVSVSDNLITLKPERGWTAAHSKEELVEEMTQVLEEYPGIGYNFSQPIELRMMELIEGVGIRSDLGIKLFGPDIDELARQAQTIAGIVNQVEGAADVQAEVTQGLPQLQIDLQRDVMARHGISVDDVNEVIEHGLGGQVVTEVVDGSSRFGVAVRFPPEVRNDPEQIAALRVPTPAGGSVALGEVTDIESTLGPAQISRENGQRRVVVQSNVRGRDLGSFVEEVRQRLDAELDLPTGYHLEYGGTYEKLSSGRARLGVVVPLTFLGVFFLLFATFRSIRQALLVFTGIPFAVTGGILALGVRGMPFSISAGIGFIALAGIAVLNGIVMLTFINRLREDGVGLRESVFEGAVQRLRPVLMTAAVASFGFLPMALSHSAGAEVQRPLATVVIGGLITSTILTLLLLPTLYEWAEARADRRKQTA